VNSLASLFEIVAERLKQDRSDLNQSDTLNANHGDHMIAIFQVASQAALQMSDNDLAAAMDLAASKLGQIDDNASAQLYALGLQQFSNQFRKQAINFDDLVTYIHSALAEDKQSGPKNPKAGDVLKALVSGLAGWQSASQNEAEPKREMDMGYLFDLGVIYLQAKQRTANKVEALAETAVSVSPLGKTPYRAQSGKLVILTLLKAMAG
jgi:hypothetical protein